MSTPSLFIVFSSLWDMEGVEKGLAMFNLVSTPWCGCQPQTVPHRPGTCAHMWPQIYLTYEPQNRPNWQFAANLVKNSFFLSWSGIGYGVFAPERIIGVYKTWFGWSTKWRGGFKAPELLLKIWPPQNDPIALHTFANLVADHRCRCAVASFGVASACARSLCGPAPEYSVHIYLLDVCLEAGWSLLSRLRIQLFTDQITKINHISQHQAQTTIT